MKTKTLSESVRELRYELDELQKVKFEVRKQETEIDRIILQLNGRALQKGFCPFTPSKINQST